jgi:tRNA threonylcarbamoyladenosine biosynthesis protein TsaB
MVSFLAIETSTKACSLVLTVDGQPVFERINLDGASHSSLLGVFVFEAVKYARANNFDISAVAVSSGPGSYTGLRIGVSEAKGLCYGFGIPLIAIPTLKILAAGVRFSCGESLGEGSILCPMIDARRMEVYSALYDGNLNEIRPVQADIVDENSFREYLEHHPVVFFGDGSDKCRALIQSPNARFINSVYPAATAMIPLVEEAFAAEKFEDVAYFEPFYLKEFQATVAKNKVINH